MFKFDFVCSCHFSGYLVVLPHLLPPAGVTASAPLAPYLGLASSESLSPGKPELSVGPVSANTIVILQMKQCRSANATAVHAAFLIANRRKTRNERSLPGPHIPGTAAAGGAPLSGSLNERSHPWRAA